MKLCGHTMGTPDLTLEQAIQFFSDIGYEGIEIRCAEDGHLQPEQVRPREIDAIRNLAHSLGLQIACLTPYYSDYSTDQATEATVAGLTQVAKVAAELGCQLVRAIAWQWPVEGFSLAEARGRLAEGLRRAGDGVAEYGVQLAVETHGGTLAFDSAASVELVKQADHPNVGLLLDYYWLQAAGDDDPDAVMPELAPLTIHVHVKDLVLEGGKPRAVPLGRGRTDWPKILAHLMQAGYTGFLSDEYEKHWRRELPDPRVAMPANRQQMLRWLEQARQLASAER